MAVLIIENRRAEKFAKNKKYCLLAYGFTLIDVIFSAGLFLVFRYLYFVYFFKFIPLLSLVTSGIFVLIFGKKIYNKIKG